MTFLLVSSSSLAIPAEAGIQPLLQHERLDPGFRRDDGTGIYR